MEGRLASLAFTVAFVLAVDVPVMAALPSYSGFPHRIDTTTAGNHRAPGVAFHPGSFPGHVYVWESEGQDGSGAGVFGIDSYHPEFQVNTYTDGDQGSPAAAALGDATIIVWQSDAQDGSGTGIYGRIYDTFTNPTGPEWRLNDETAGDQSSPAVVELPGEPHWMPQGFLAAWHSASVPSAPEIRVHRFTPQGTPAGPEGIASEGLALDSAGPPALAADALDRAVIVWAGRDQQTGSASVYARLYDAGGTPQGGPILVQTGFLDPEGRTSVSKDRFGRITVVWSAADISGGLTRIWARRLSETGVPIGPAFKLNTDAFLDQLNPVVVSQPGGSFFTAWHRDFGSNSNLQGRTADSLGVPQDQDFFVAGGHLDTEPSLGRGLSGDFILTWTATRSDGPGTEIHAWYFCGVPAVDPPQDRTVCEGGTAEFSAPFYSGSGYPIARWRRDGQDLFDSDPYVGTTSSYLTVRNANIDMQGAYQFAGTDQYCTPVQSFQSASATLTVLVIPARAAGLRIAKVAAGSGLHLSWADQPGAADYVVYQDSAPGGGFASQAGTATSGASGIELPLPAGNVFYLVGARNTCGDGPVH